jgi:hypothetical protein
MLEGDLQATTALLATSGVRVEALEVVLGDTHKLLEGTHAEGKQASEAWLKLKAQVEVDAKNLHQTAERMAQALAELRLLPSSILAGLVSEIALWYADALKQLRALPGMLK